MRNSMKCVALGSFALACFTLTGCQYRTKADAYVLVASNLKLPYWQSVQEGFKDAGDAYKVTTTVEGPDGFDPDAEVQAFRQAVANKPKGILVSAVGMQQSSGLRFNRRSRRAFL